LKPSSTGNLEYLNPPRFKVEKIVNIASNRFLRKPEDSDINTEMCCLRNINEIYKVDVDGLL
jgi:hypothetical protein